MTLNAEAVQLIKIADEKEREYLILEDCCEESCEPNELEARQDQAYSEHIKSCEALAKHLIGIMGNCDFATVRKMAFEKRIELSSLFNKTL